MAQYEFKHLLAKSVLNPLPYPTTIKILLKIIILADIYIKENKKDGFLFYQQLKSQLNNLLKRNLL